MTIGYDQIPLGLSVPGHYVEITNSGALQGALGVQPFKALLIGQKLSAGTATEGEISLIDAGNEANLFGYNSVLARACRAFKQLNPLVELHAIPLDDASGTAASGTLAFSGTATEDGSVVVYFGGRRVEVAVASGDDATAVGVAVDAALDLESDLPVTPSNVTGTVTLTHLHDGTIGNEFKIGHSLQDNEVLPAGISCVVTQLASGATDPDFDTAATAIGDEQYNVIGLCIASKTEIDKILAAVEAKWGATVQKEGVIITAKTGTQGSLSTYGNSYNSFALSVVGMGVSGLTRTVEEVAAAVAAIVARKAQAQPAKPYTYEPLPATFLAEHRAARFTFAQRNILLTDGVSTMLPSTDGRMTIERLITTYQTTGGIPDPSYKDIMILTILSYLRFSLRARMTLRYPQHILVDDGPVPPGQDIVTPGTVRSEMISLYIGWSELGLVEAAYLDTFKERLLVERPPTDRNRVDVLLPPDLSNAFLVGAYKLAYVL